MEQIRVVHFVVQNRCALRIQFDDHSVLLRWRLDWLRLNDRLWWFLDFGFSLRRKINNKPLLFVVRK